MRTKARATSTLLTTKEVYINVQSIDIRLRFFSESRDQDTWLPGRNVDTLAAVYNLSPADGR